ncbi:LssY C-terminal domain-containing protein [Aliiroseovarius halocynthiae]|uniref:LssY C-terminal domain-containing protein n=1 Tax=Aliiroseovarius halocynthiae TaxID=985055 RepID=UPI00163D8481|nr:LssY C-terminal domain-containing protein [Aliiroseovarius halocynthiae]
MFGEAAFLTAGAVWAANGQIWPAFIVLFCAWAGDISSYAIGRHYGARLSLRYLNRLKRRRAWRRAKDALKRRGAAFVILSRLLGPTAWVTPFLAGSMSMKASHFAPAAAIGVLIGVGQFILLGAVGLQGFSQIAPFVTDHIGTIVLLILLLGSSVYVWRRSEAGYFMRALKAAGAAIALFLASNVAYFFVLNTHGRAIHPAPVIRSVCDIPNHPLLVHPGETSLHLPQPVNVILISKASGAELMDDLGWHQNLTFSRSRITIVSFVRLLAHKTPPVSELLLSGQPANSAFQMPGTLKTREHIRWWDFGNDVSFGAISRDDELAIKYYRQLPVLLHDIDPRVDLSRDLLAPQIENSNRFEVVGYAGLGDAVSDGVLADFQTDGRILIVADRWATISPEAIECLNITPATAS